MVTGPGWSRIIILKDPIKDCFLMDVIKKGPWVL